MRYAKVLRHRKEEYSNITHVFSSIQITYFSLQIYLAQIHLNEVKICFLKPELYKLLSRRFKPSTFF